MVFFNGMSFKTLFLSAKARNNGLITRSNSMIDLGEEYERMGFLCSWNHKGLGKA